MNIDDTTLRVVFTPKYLSVRAFGEAENVEGIYFDEDELPVLLQRKIAILRTIKVGTPPPGNEVNGVGRRINENVFWLYMVDGDGIDS